MSTDAYAAGRLETAYALSEQLAPFGLRVEVKDGVATVAGAVDDKVLRDLAIEIARDLDEVKDVRNEIAVEIGAPHRNGHDHFAQRFDNANLCAKVKSRLTWNGATHSAAIEVTADSGTVTLTGMVANREVRDIAGRLAAEARGTVAVDNQLRIRTDN